MLALSIKQPFAELILQGVKTREFRTMPTRIRGRVHIYASLVPREGMIKGMRGIDYPLGYIVGSVEISGCRKTRNGYAWELSNPKRLKKPRRPVNKPQPVWFSPF